MKIDAYRLKIVRFLKNKSISSSKEISELLNISLATAQRLVIALEDEGVVARFHGGLTLNSSYKTSQNELIPHYKLKKELALYVRNHIIKNGQAIYIGSGNTPSLIGEYLHQFKELTIITNNLLLLPALRSLPHIHTIFTGGIFNHHMPSMVSNIYPLNYLTDKLNIQSAFVTSPAVSTLGCSQQENFVHQVIEEHFINLPNVTSYLLADESKLGLNYSFRWTASQKITHILTNRATHESQKLESQFSVLYCQE